MTFADLHNHILSGVDDGAQSDEIMYRMAEAAYADGTRLLCLTPHFHPGVFGDNREAGEASFQKLCNYAAEHWPDLKLFLGNELRYTPSSDRWLREGLCRTLANSSLILVDFPADVGQNQITRALEQLLSMGYLPVLAHAERYPNLSMNAIREYRRNGILIQINAGSLTGSFGWAARSQAKRLLRNRLVCLVASDAHDLKHRPPLLSKGYAITKKITDENYANRVFLNNAIDLLEQTQEGLVKEDE